jgi:hypothetical protein
VRGCSRVGSPSVDCRIRQTATDRGRKHRLVSMPPPSEPDMRVSRHTALRLVVLPARGLTCCEMGVLQVEKPKRIKVGNGPACLVGAVRSGTPFPMGLTAQYASQSASDESIFRAECLVVAMFEVLKPAPQRPVHVSDGLGHATSAQCRLYRPVAYRWHGQCKLHTGSVRLWDRLR